MTDDSVTTSSTGAGPAFAPLGRAPGDATLLGVLEDDRLKATVSTTGDHTVVTLEGHLDRDTAPVVDELLEAVARWHRHRDRAPVRDAIQVAVEGPHESGDDRRPTLWLDARGIEDGHPLGWSVLAGHRARWLREQGACVTWRRS